MPGGVSANATEYLTVSLHANTGYQLSLTQFTFKESRTSGGPASMSPGVFVGGVLQETSATITTKQIGQTPTASMNSHTFDLADLTAIASTSDVEFRIYGWGGISGAGVLRLDEFTVSGSVAAASAIPEPSAYAAICGVVRFARCGDSPPSQPNPNRRSLTPRHGKRSGRKFCRRFPRTRRLRVNHGSPSVGRNTAAPVPRPAAPSTPRPRETAAS